MFSKETISEIAAVARSYGIEAAALLAVADIESGSVAYADINGKREPLIRFEGHYFDARLSPADRQQARRLGLADPRPGKIANPQTQSGRWRLLDSAAAINRTAAYESTSWGLGQVMGSHWKMLGFASVDELMREARSGAAGQARLAAGFIVGTGLERPLRNHDWRAFARGYNGPFYARNRYHSRIADAWRRYSDMIGTQFDAGLLRIGVTGVAVERLQTALNRLGYRLTVDGLFGRATRAAVVDLQRRRRLPADGVVGPVTLHAIESPPVDESRAKTLLEALRGLFSAER